MIKRICKACNRKFKTWPCYIKRGGGIFCSKKCRGIYEYPTRDKFIETNKKIVSNQKGKNNFNWKGDRVGYKGFHWRLNEYLGKPKFCELCGTTIAKQFHWANKSKKYKYDFNDYFRLCISCHRKLDWNEKYRKRERGRFICVL